MSIDVYLDPLGQNQQAFVPVGCPIELVPTLACTYGSVAIHIRVGRPKLG